MNSVGWVRELVRERENRVCGCLWGSLRCMGVCVIWWDIAELEKSVGKTLAECVRELVRA